jgi:hypothetical protein
LLFIDAPSPRQSRFVELLERAHARHPAGVVPSVQGLVADYAVQADRRLATGGIRIFSLL